MFEKIEELYLDALRNGHVSRRTPPADVYMSNGSLIVMVDLPGYRRENIRVKVGENYVEVTAYPSAQDVGDAIIRERMANHVAYRRIELRHRVRVDGARATYRDGVLIVTLPIAGGLSDSELSIE